MKRITSLAAALALTGLASQANALAIGDANYLGYVDPGNPADAPSEVAYINALLGMEQGASTTDCSPPLPELGGPGDYACSRVNSTIEEDPLPLAVVTDAGKIESPATGSINVDAWEYILAKYGDTSYVWYVGNLSGTQELAMSIGQGGGLSHISFYNFTNVPEPGMLSLLGAGLVGVALVRRRRALKA